MLIPRFNVRTLLVITTICAVVASMFSWALAGTAWAAGVASAAAFVATAFLLYGLLFLVAFGFSWFRPAAKVARGAADVDTVSRLQPNGDQ
jgi:hypothetical protein